MRCWHVECWITTEDDTARVEQCGREDWEHPCQVGQALAGLGEVRPRPALHHQVGQAGGGGGEGHGGDGGDGIVKEGGIY